MRGRHLGAAGLFLLLAACGSGASDPGAPPGDETTGLVRSAVSDPAGDTFGNRGPQWDLTALAVSRDTEAVTVVLTFTSAPIDPRTGDPNAMLAFVDLDTDLDSTTGNPSIADEFRRDSATTGLGSDFRLDLATFDDDSTFAVFDESGTVTGRVRPVFAGTTVTVRIRRSMLGNDDGFLNAAALVGTAASPTDLVPERGALALRPAAATLAPHTGGSHLTRISCPGMSPWPSAPTASSASSTKRSSRNCTSNW